MFSKLILPKTLRREACNTGPERRIWVASSQSISPNCAAAWTLKGASAINEAHGKLQIASKRSGSVSSRPTCDSKWRLQCQRPAKEKHRQHCSEYDRRPFRCEKNRLPGTRPFLAELVRIQRHAASMPVSMPRHSLSACQRCRFNGVKVSLDRIEKARYVQFG